MKNIQSIKISSISIFLLSFISVNLCLILSQVFVYTEYANPELSGVYFRDWKIFEVGDAIGEKGLPWIIPYFDGTASISRVVRVFPNYLIFKPAMWLTGFFLIRYWLLNKKVLYSLGIINKDVNSAINQLKFSNKRVSSNVLKVLNSAIANAENNNQLDIDKLFVKQAYVGKSLRMKRWRPRAKGRPGSIIKPFSKITIIVEERAEIKKGSK